MTSRPSKAEALLPFLVITIKPSGQTITNSKKDDDSAHLKLGKKISFQSVVWPFLDTLFGTCHLLFFLIPQLISHFWKISDFYLVGQKKFNFKMRLGSLKLMKSLRFFLCFYDLLWLVTIYLSPLEHNFVYCFSVAFRFFRFREYKRVKCILGQFWVYSWFGPRHDLVSVVLRNDQNHRSSNKGWWRSQVKMSLVERTKWLYHCQRHFRFLSLKTIFLPPSRASLDTPEERGTTIDISPIRILL